MDGSVPTASFLFRSKYIKNIPDWYKDCTCGDTPLRLIMTSFGYSYYIDEVMSVYRKETGISVTDEWNKNIEQWRNNDTREKIVRFKDGLHSMVYKFDEYTNYKYSKGLSISKMYYELQKLVDLQDYKEILKSNYKKYYNIQYGDILCMKLRIKVYLPKIYDFLKKVVKK